MSNYSNIYENVNTCIEYMIKFMEVIIMKKLVKSRTNRMISGVCAGIADYFNLDPVLVRLLFVVLTFFSFGTMLLFYIISLFLIPEDNAIQ